MSSDGYTFLETVKDSYLAQHIKTSTKGRDTNEESILDLPFISRDEAIEDTNGHSPLTNLVTL